jgi:hypothetical protein
MLKNWYASRAITVAFVITGLGIPGAYAAVAQAAVAQAAVAQAGGHGPTTDRPYLEPEGSGLLRGTPDGQQAGQVEKKSYDKSDEQKPKHRTRKISRSTLHDPQRGDPVKEGTERTP